jgi:hypothetical protein
MMILFSRCHFSQSGSSSNDGGQVTAENLHGPLDEIISATSHLLHSSARVLPGYQFTECLKAFRFAGDRIESSRASATMRRKKLRRPLPKP